MKMLRIICGKLLYVLKFNVQYLGTIIQVSCPVLLVIIPKFADEPWWLKVVIVLASHFAGYLLKEWANVQGVGQTVPLPPKRFTRSDDKFGEVYMDYDDMQEMLLYMNELEEFLTRTGRMQQQKKSNS